MKHFSNILILSAFLFASFTVKANAVAPTLPQQLEQKIHSRHPHGNPLALMINLQQSVLPVSSAAKEASVWDTIGDFLTGQGKKDKVSAVAAYLYNVYIADAVYKQTLPPSRLDFNYIGTLDYLYARAVLEKDYPSFYADNKEDIKAELAIIFKQKTGIDYNVADERNTLFEKVFINTLAKSKDSKGRYGYVYGAGKAAGGLSSQGLVNQLKAALDKDRAKNNNLVSTYKEVDLMAVMDHAKSNTVNKYYRPVNEECAVCTYNFCRSICGTLKNKYDDWRVIKVYTLFAYPQKDKFIKTAQNTEQFVNPATKKLYPQWDYHAATLLVLNKDYHIIYIVVDPMLLAQPATLGAWSSLFSQDTNYIIGPFRRSKAIEKNIVEKSKLSKEYSPYPVRN